MLTDRVRAIGAAWLGQTTGCAQCHDHKFDPFTMRDFYSLGAFFADIQEPILGRREDGHGRRHAGATRSSWRSWTPTLAEAKTSFEAVLPQLDAAQQQWEADVVAYDVTLPELRRTLRPRGGQKAAQQVAADSEEARADAAAEARRSRTTFAPR